MFITLGKNRTNPIETVIDIEDLEKAQEIAGYWYARYSWTIKGYYVQTTIDGKAVYLHRKLFDEIPAGLVVDHINRNTLDNRRSTNMRIVTPSENLSNQRKRGSVRGRRTSRRAKVQKIIL